MQTTSPYVLGTKETAQVLALLHSRVRPVSLLRQNSLPLFEALCAAVGGTLVCAGPRCRRHRAQEWHSVVTCSKSCCTGCSNSCELHVQDCEQLLTCSIQCTPHDITGIVDRTLGPY